MTKKPKGEAGRRSLFPNKKAALKLKVQQSTRDQVDELIGVAGVTASDLIELLIKKHGRREAERLGGLDKQKLYAKAAKGKGEASQELLRVYKALGIGK